MFYLNDLDIYNLDFKKFIYLDGGVYKISRIIDYEAGKNTPTKVELLRVIYKSSSIVDTAPNWQTLGVNTCVSCNNYVVYQDTNPYSSTYNNYQVNGVNIGSTAPTFGSCSTSPTWTSQSYNTCSSCGTYLVYRNTNACSTTYNNYQVNGVDVGATAPVSGSCDVTPDFVSQAYNTCVDCVTYLVYRDTKLCSPTYGNYRVNGVNVGNTAPVSGSCNTSPIYTNQFYYTCSSCGTYLVYRDTNVCSETEGIYRVNGVDVGYTAPTDGACNTTANWVSQAYNTCVSCVNYLVYRDTNPCSATYNNYRVNGINVGNTAPASGNCNTTASWTSQSYNTCVSCVNYLVYRDTNPCSATYNNYQVNGVNVGNTAPTNGNCNTSAVYNSNIGLLYVCSSGSVFSYAVYQNTNPCFTGNQYFTNGSSYATNPSNSAPNTTQNWVANGAQYCSGFDLYEPQIQTNECATGYNTTRNFLIQANSCTCNTSPLYNLNIGTLYICNNGSVLSYIVYQNTNTCFTGNQFFTNGSSYATNPSNTAPNTTQNWVPNGSRYCSGLDLYEPQIQTNECAVNYNGVRDQLIESNSPTCAESYTMSNCLGGGATTYSATYTIGSFSVNERVTSSGVTYVITGTTTPTSGISITSTGQTGCPEYTQFTDYCTMNIYYILGTGYSSMGTSTDVPDGCLQPTGTTSTPSGTQIYNFTSDPGCECV
jgi:hypothetical protein